jgi:type I restriction enzyme S subunit
MSNTVIASEARQSSWRECKLGDVVSSNNKSIDKNYEFKNIQYLDTGSITNNKIDGFQEFKISEVPSRAKRLVKHEDIVYSTVRPIQRHFGFIEKPQENLVVSTGFVVIETNRKLAYPKFIYYFLSSNEIVEILDVIAEASTSAYPSLKPSDIENLDIFLPPLEEQKRIAEVLSSLDDKIDLLHRQNQTLESLAQTLFRQWFIEEAKDEWEEKPLSFFGDIICGKTPSKSNPQYFDGNVPFIKIPDMHGNTFIFRTTDTLSELGKESQKNKTLPAKSICVSCIATVGLVSMNIVESQTNQQINSIVPNKDIYRYFLYLFMQSSYELLHAMASGGTATLNLNTGDFSKMEILKPDDETLQKFHEIIEPTFDIVFINSKQIQTLENLRDTLLPRLLSGEVRVEI